MFYTYQGPHIRVERRDFRQRIDAALLQLPESERQILFRASEIYKKKRS